MNDSNADTSDLIGIVVDERGHTVLVGPLKLELFLNLAMHRGPVGIRVEGKQAFVIVIDVTSDPIDPFATRRFSPDFAPRT